MISWLDVNGVYVSCLFVLIFFPVMWFVCRHFKLLNPMSENVFCLFWAVVSTYAVVFSILFIFQDYGLSEQVQARYDREITRIEAEYDKLVEENRTLEEKKAAAFRFERDIYRKIIIETLENGHKRRR